MKTRIETDVELVERLNEALGMLDLKVSSLSELRGHVNLVRRVVESARDTLRYRVHVAQEEGETS